MHITISRQIIIHNNTKPFVTLSFQPNFNFNFTTASNPAILSSTTHVYKRGVVPQLMQNGRLIAQNAFCLGATLKVIKAPCYSNNGKENSKARLVGLPWRRCLFIRVLCLLSRVERGEVLQADGLLLGALRWLLPTFQGGGLHSADIHAAPSVVTAAVEEAAAAAAAAAANAKKAVMIYHQKPAPARETTSRKVTQCAH
jgi:hypothetical protein